MCAISLIVSFEGVFIGFNPVSRVPVYWIGRPALRRIAEGYGVFQA
jgi:hypothetical protein